jgi:uncharacterized membrane protein
MTTLLEKVLLYGCLGLLGEVFFTAADSLIQKNWNATGKTYLWMLPIYGFSALGFEAMASHLAWPFYLKALLYVVTIYAIEASTGWAIKRLIGTIPWDYGKSPWTPGGLINLKMAPYWLILALLIDPIFVLLHKLLYAFSLVF